MASSRATLASFLSTAALLASVHAEAGFYRWVDARGQVRISNIPPRGVAADGSVLPGFNPHSITAQQAALRQRLAARDAELAREQAAAAAGTPPSADAAAPTQP